MDVFPLRLRGRVIGTLAIFQERPGRLTGADLTVAQALAGARLWRAAGVRWPGPGW